MHMVEFVFIVFSTDGVSYKKIWRSKRQEKIEKRPHIVAGFYMSKLIKTGIITEQKSLHYGKLSKEPWET